MPGIGARNLARCSSMGPWREFAHVVAGQLSSHFTGVGTDTYGRTSLRLTSAGVGGVFLKLAHSLLVNAGHRGV